MRSSDVEEILAEQLDSLNDPYDVLKLFGDKLGNEGNIKDAANVSFFRKMMMGSDKLVSQCMFVSVLQATKDKTVILKVLNDGAWKILYGWLQDAKSAVNKAFLLELLKLYQELPVTVDLLKQNSCAKDIRHLSKCADKKISTMAQDIVERWMHLVKEKSGEIPNKSDKTSNHTLSHSSSSKSPKDKKTSAKNSDATTNHSHQSSLKSRTSENKTLSNNSNVGHGNLNSDNTSQDSTSNSSTSVTKETVQRPKTVKMVGNMFRSTGLEVASPLPHSKKKASSTQNNSQPVPSTKKPPTTTTVVEKKTSITIPPASTPSSSTSSATSPTEVKPKIKIVPAKSKPPEIFESSGFMDAIGSHEIVPVRRKRKLSQTNPIQKSSSSSNSASASQSSSSATDDKKPAMPSFYRDTMEMSAEELSKFTGEKGNTSPTNGIRTGAENDAEAMDTSENDKSQEIDPSVTVSEDNDDSSKNGEKNSVDETSEPQPKKKKKAVTWPDDNKLCSFFYFQLDETERVNVNKIDFAETRKHELEMERQMFQNVKRMAHDTMAAKTQWRKPSLLTGGLVLVMSGCNSTERKVQIEREQSVLQVLYFSKNMIPDTPVEADLEYFEFVEPKDIPLTDVSGNGEACYDHVAPSTMGAGNPDVVPLLNLFGGSAPSAVGGREMPKNPGMQPQTPQMMQQMRPGPMPPFVQPMYNMPSQMQQGMPPQMQQGMPPQMQPGMPPQMQPPMPPQMQHQMPPNMNMPMMDGRPNQNNVGYDMTGPNQGPMMPLMAQRPGMVQGGRGFPPMRPDFMMGPGPQNHPAMRGAGDMDMNRMPGMPGRNDPMMNSQDMNPRMMPPRDMQPRGPRPVCSHFMNGYCRYGNNCRYLHQRGNGSPH